MQTQSEMNRMAGAEAHKADTEMTKVYLRLMKQLSGSDAIALRDSQRAWLKFRDADCKFRSGAVQGGSMYPTVYAGYLRQLTVARTKELLDAEKTFRTEGDT